jgi:hypothetical protein
MDAIILLSLAAFVIAACTELAAASARRGRAALSESERQVRLDFARAASLQP